MANITYPYADPGRASFEELDTYLQNFLLAGNHPELKPAYSYPLALNTSFLQFSVVGLDPDGKIAMATRGIDAVAATGVLTFSGTGTAADTVTIGGREYTLVDTLTGADDILIGASATETGDNLAAALNGGAGEGTVYGTGTEQNADVSAVAAVGVVTVTARQIGAEGNDITTAESGTGASWAGAATTLSGGLDRGGVQAVGVMAHAADLGGSGAATGPVWYSGAFNAEALVWDDSFDTDAEKEAAFRGAPTPTTIIIAKRDYS